MAYPAVGGYSEVPTVPKVAHCQLQNVSFV